MSASAARRIELDRLLHIDYNVRNDSVNFRNDSVGFMMKALSALRKVQGDKACECYSVTVFV